jgi:hypothetical protein
VEGLRTSHCGVNKKNFNYVLKTIEITPTKCTSLVLVTRLMYMRQLLDAACAATALCKNIPAAARLLGAAVSV